MKTIAQPPIHMSTPHGPQVAITSVLAVVVLALVAAGIVLALRNRNPKLLLVLVGGYVCSLNEPLIDMLCRCYFPSDGWTVHRIFDRSIPLWVALAYVVFYGGLSFIIAAALRAGTSRRALWIGMTGWGALNLLMEIPLLKSGLYDYYGDQPFSVGGFPLGQMVFNIAGSLLCAVVLVRLDWLFKGPRLALLILVPSATFVTSWMLGMPYFLLLGANASASVAALGDVVCVVVALFVVDGLIRLGTGEWRLLPPEQTAADRAAAPLMPEH